MFLPEEDCHLDAVKAVREGREAEVELWPAFTKGLKIPRAGIGCLSRPCAADIVHGTAAGLALTAVMDMVHPVPFPPWEAQQPS